MDRARRDPPPMPPKAAPATGRDAALHGRSTHAARRPPRSAGVSRTPPGGGSRDEDAQRMPPAPTDAEPAAGDGGPVPTPVYCRELGFTHPSRPSLRRRSCAGRHSRQLSPGTWTRTFGSQLRSLDLALWLPVPSDPGFRCVCLTIRRIFFISTLFCFCPCLVWYGCTAFRTRRAVSGRDKSRGVRPDGFRTMDIMPESTQGAVSDILSASENG